MSLLVSKEGILSSIQDFGRTGYRKFGLNVTGVMDRAAARLLNTLLGNEENIALIEMHFPAGELVFEAPVKFAVGGADFSPVLSKQPIDNWTVYAAGTGDTLKFAGKGIGQRTYLAVSGGFTVDRWLHSQSTNLAAGIGGFHGRRLVANDRIEFDTNVDSDSGVGFRLGRSAIHAYSNKPIIRIIPGPEFDSLTALSTETLLREEFRILHESNRMGFRLKGPPIHLLSETEMLSSAVTFGTIQRLPDGQLIVLMADHQTTGGYPRIANVADADLPLLAQLGSGDKVRFELIDQAKGEELVMEMERTLARLRVGIRIKRVGHL